MATHTFQVSQKQIPGKHEHSYEAQHVETGKVFALPEGGNGKYVGAYPEIDDYLKNNYGVQAVVAYTAAPADKFEPDYSTGVYKWTYQRNGHEVIVHDIDRVAASFEVVIYRDPK